METLNNSNNGLTLLARFIVWLLKEHMIIIIAYNAICIIRWVPRSLFEEL